MRLNHSLHPFVPAELIAQQLYEQGYAICDTFIDAEHVQSLIDDTQNLWDEGEFRFAKVGTGNDKQLCPAVRSDRIHWLNPQQITPSQEQYLEQLEKLRLAINQATMLGLFEWEGHLAVYPSGTFYRRHLDVFRNARERTISTILYLNQNWSPIDGGELRLFLEGQSLDKYIDIPPLAGRLVVFLSERFYHEVLLAHAQRMSITGWFRVRSTHGL